MSNKIYGIDLGTTNSYIAYDGKILGGVVKSIVNLDKKSTTNFDDLNAMSSFKVDISTSNEGKPSVAASSLVLRQLVKQSGEDVRDVVISVPAFFTDSQRTATKDAAVIAGLNVRALVNEPTAAAIAITRDSRRLAIVYDLGGGTFDVTAIDTRLSKYDVTATDGKIIGGDDLDNEIMMFLIKASKMKIHKLTKDMRITLKLLATKVKLECQANYTEGRPTLVTLDEFADIVRNKRIIITKDEYAEMSDKVFNRTYEETLKVISESAIGDEYFDLLLVGGSTYCPHIRKRVEEETGVKPAELTYSPDEIVAEGASLYAKMIEDGTAEEMIADVTSRLSIKLSDGTTKTIIRKNEHVPAEGSHMFTNPIDTDHLDIDIYQGDSLIAVNNSKIGTVKYNYGKIIPKGTSALKIKFKINVDGILTVTVKDLLGEEVVAKIDRREVRQ